MFLYLFFFYKNGTVKEFQCFGTIEIILLGSWVFLVYSGIIPNLVSIKVYVYIKNQGLIKRKVKLNFKWYG